MGTGENHHPEIQQPIFLRLNHCPKEIQNTPPTISGAGMPDTAYAMF